MKNIKSWLSLSELLYSFQIALRTSCSVSSKLVTLRFDIFKGVNYQKQRSRVFRTKNLFNVDLYTNTGHKIVFVSLSNIPFLRRPDNIFHFKVLLSIYSVIIR